MGGEVRGCIALELWMLASTSSATLGPRQHGERSGGKEGVNKLHVCREELAFRWKAKCQEESRGEEAGHCRP